MGKHRIRISHLRPLLAFHGGDFLAKGRHRRAPFGQRQILHRPHLGYKLLLNAHHAVARIFHLKRLHGKLPAIISHRQRLLVHPQVHSLPTRGQGAGYCLGYFAWQLTPMNCPHRGHGHATAINLHCPIRQFDLARQPCAIAQPHLAARQGKGAAQDKADHSHHSGLSPSPHFSQRQPGLLLGRNSRHVTLGACEYFSRC